MAAATDFSDLEVGWRSVHSAVTNAGFCGFLNAVNVWIERPNVLNRRLMGALIVKKSSIEHLTGSDLEKFLFLFDAQSKYLCQGTEIEGETLHFENGGVPVSSDDKEANAPNRLVKDSDCSEELVSCIVRKLIPRSRQVHVDSKGAMFELVIVGKCS